MKQTRRGAIAPLAAVSLVLLLAMVAFSIDISYVGLTRAQLQNAADSAALAGVQQLMDNLPLFYTSQSDTQKYTLAVTAINAARTKAKEFAAANSAGARANLILLDSDIKVGYTNAAGVYADYYATSNDYPNTVKVVVRRDNSANSVLSLFFAPVLGTDAVALTASAAATLYAGTIDSLDTDNIEGVLPITYDADHWKDFLGDGRDPDDHRSVDAEGNPELQVYPSIKATGNFGQLSLNDSTNGASTIRDWIDNGITADDVAALKSNNLLPISGHNSNSWDWKGNPGMKASTVMAMNDHQGETFLLPLFKAFNSSPTNYAAGSGNGTNYNYNITGFVAIKIQPTDDYNGSVIVAPSARIFEGDVGWVPNSVVPAGSGTTRAVTTFSTPKLTQ
jgi:Flp pilus assembly protein TadG